MMLYIMAFYRRSTTKFYRNKNTLDKNDANISNLNTNKRTHFRIVFLQFSLDFACDLQRESHNSSFHNCYYSLFYYYFLRDILVSSFLISCTILTAVSRVFLRYHSVVQVLAGLTLGMLMGVAFDYGVQQHVPYCLKIRPSNSGSISFDAKTNVYDSSHKKVA